ncbi:MAG: anthranilate phosphoribosyltransferase [Chitinivibrionales bacterium]|nr:anthranilate phosphoribosyltransferase [Chitinivibrionales bacterium]MBD3395250.1 anthranilate phosphoribosyltransferase [Chitinivibrionales bacterium]
MAIQEALRKVVDGNSLSLDETRAAFEEIMSGGATEAQIAGLLVALRMKGESIDEITGAAQVMREKATPVMPARAGHVIDTCGTGGDRSGTFNVSTATAFVAAGAGAVVAKHGNRSVSSKCGSADVLEALGVNIGITPEAMKACLDEIGICFLFAPSLHKAMKYAIGPRKELALRTVFNVLGPLTNPSMTKRQLLGVFARDLTAPLAGALANMGSEKAYVVHGLDGLDEVSISGETQISELAGGAVKTYTVDPDAFGIPRASVEAIAGGTKERNAGIIQKVLSGRKDAYRDTVVLNAAFAIAASGICEQPEDGIALARDSIDSGAAKEKLARLAEKTRR